MWFLRRLDRLDAEMSAVAKLREEGWLTTAEWGFDLETGALRAEIDFLAGGSKRKAWLTYPHAFPYAPPRVTPRDSAARWSGHQWGAGGELCLAIRADNWQPHYTGADMLASARHLLSTEDAPGADGLPGRVPSAHAFTLGQRLRYDFSRFVDTPAPPQRLATEPAGCRAVFNTELGPGSFVWVLASLTLASGETWNNPDLPKSLTDSAHNKGFAIVLPESDSRADRVRDASATGAAELWALFVDEPLEGYKGLATWLPSGPKAFFLSAETDKITELGIVPVDGAGRLPPQNARLASKRIAILGAGSVGSKSAASLARAGALDFLLVDDDVFCPENLARHELDWRSVGAHKVDALQEHIQLIQPRACVTLRRQQLGGQNSSKFLHEALEDIGACDLIVDASGSANGFNYAAGVAEQMGIPLVWARVFGGGYGGLIARSRPGIDPPPLAARAQIDSWCANPEFPVPPQAVIDYGILDAEQKPMVADDADVGAIAAHFARFVVDLLANEKSEFEASAYMIGLRKEWIFTGPFDTRPITLLPVARPNTVSGKIGGETTSAVVAALPLIREQA